MAAPTSPIFGRHVRLLALLLIFVAGAAGAVIWWQIRHHGEAAFSLSVSGPGSVRQEDGRTCAGLCDRFDGAGDTIVIEAVPNGDALFEGWSGACHGKQPRCQLLAKGKPVAFATFSNRYDNQSCKVSDAHVIWQAPPESEQFRWKRVAAPGSPGDDHYVVGINDWGHAPATMWVRDATCWGAGTLLRRPGPLPVMAPQVTRGWLYNAEAVPSLSSPGTQDWTVQAGMAVPLSQLTHAKVHWAMKVPQHPFPATRWDALVDIFFHRSKQPDQSTGWYPQADLMIIQHQMDSGYFAGELRAHHGFKITVGGVRYVGMVDVGKFNQPGGHTITMMARPTDWSDQSGRLWGQPVLTHDIAAIVHYWMQANPLDEDGRPILGASGTPVVEPLLHPDWYLTAVNGDFEIYADDSVDPWPWKTTNFWVSVQDEPDGPGETTVAEPPAKH